MSIMVTADEKGNNKKKNSDQFECLEGLRSLWDNTMYVYILISVLFWSPVHQPWFVIQYLLSLIFSIAKFYLVQFYLRIYQLLVNL